MTTARIAVLEADPELVAGTEAWHRLGERLARLSPDLLVLNELPFGIWLASSHEFDNVRWNASVAIHDEAIARLAELNVPAVVGSRPLTLPDGNRVNAGFSWTAEDGAVVRHHKRHLPHGPGYWETTWTAAGTRPFEPFEIAGITVGFMVCTDIMFPEHARAYGRQGVDLIVCPRATPILDEAMFHAALSMAATVSGSYVASSNRGYTDSDGFSYEGNGYVISPRAITLAATTPEESLLVVDIDTENARTKQARYPCDVD